MKINNVTIKTPSSIKFNLCDIDAETNRSANGTMIRDRVAVKRKLECEWNSLTIAELSAILQASSNVSFPVYYLDGKSGSWETRTFYAGDRSSPVYSLVDGLPVWEGLTMDLIEV